MRTEAPARLIILTMQIGTWMPMSAGIAAEITTQPAPAVDPDHVHLRATDLYVEMESEYEQRQVKYPSMYQRRGMTHDSLDFRLTETAGMTLAGDLYDPNLLDYQAALEFGLSQTRFEERINGDRDSDDSSGFLHEYDVNVNILKAKPLSFNVYARRSENRVPRKFLPSLHELQTESGASALLTAGPTTTELGLGWKDIERTRNHNIEDDEELETSRFFLDHTLTLSENQKLKVRYDHDREQSDYQGSRYRFDTRRDEVRVEHELLFGPDKKHSLDTFLRYDAEQGDLARDELELVPRLTLTHNDQFKTIYRYGAYRFQQGAMDVSQHKFDAQALYRPNDDWRISLDGYNLYERADLDLSTYEVGGGPDVNYHKRTDAGALNVNADFDYQRTEVNGDVGRRVVHDEAHVLGGSRPVFLRHRDIVLRTVIAHNERRTRIYLQGIDYVLVPMGGRVRVKHLLTGRIAEQEVVYFDYEYDIQTDVSMNAYRSDLLMEHTFDFGLTPYYGYESRCEEVPSKPTAPRERDNAHRHRFGVRYEKDRWSNGTEYEIFDDSVEPYDAWHLTGRFTPLRSALHTLDTSAELSRYWFEGGEDKRRNWWFDMDIKDQVQFNAFTSFLGGLSYRWEDDTVDGRTHGVDVECGFRLTRGYLMVDLTLEYDLLALAENRESGFGVYLKIRRDLDHLLSTSAEQTTGEVGR